MFGFFKREYTLVFVIIIFSAIIGMAVRFSQPEIEISYPEQDTKLAAEDFWVNTDKGVIMVGISTWDEITSLYPEGETLGLSTIYRPAAKDCLFQFTEDENILDKLHIDTDYYVTYRGVKVGDPFSAVEKQYGLDYARVKSMEKPDYFEVIYGAENNIVFHIRSNLVEKIIIQHVISV